MLASRADDRIAASLRSGGAIVAGSITAQELRKALKNFEIQLSNKEMQGLMARFDQNRDGEIDAEEFENMVKDLIPAPEFDVGAIFLDQKLKSTFAKIDVNGDGSLDKDELQQGLLMLGLEMKDDQLERIIKAADIDGDGPRPDAPAPARRAVC